MYSFFKNIFGQYEGKQETFPEDLGDPSPDKKPKEKEINIDIKNLPSTKDVEYEFFYN